jgi:prepilin-type processing-associated H-X9-DG protein
MRCYLVQIVFLGLLLPGPLSSAKPTEVEKLITHAPEDMLVCIGTSGCDALQPAFDKSLLGQIWKDEGVQAFWAGVKQSVIGMIEKDLQRQSDLDKFRAVKKLLELLPRRPLLCGVSLKKTALSGNAPPIMGYLILEAGERKNSLQGDIAVAESLFEKEQVFERSFGDFNVRVLMKEGNPDLYWGWAGNYFVFAVNDENGTVINSVSSVNSVGGKVDRTLAKVSSTDDALLLFCDVQKIKDTVISVLQKEGEQQSVDKLNLALKLLGLNQLDSISSRTGFSGSEMVTETYVAAPQPHTGLLACPRPIRSSALKSIPADVMSASVCHIDPAGVYDTILHSLEGLMEPDDYQEMHNGLAEAELKVGIKIRDGFVEALDGQVVMYGGAPAPGMLSPTGSFVYLFQLKDAALFRQNLTALEEFINSLDIQGMMQITSQQIEGETVRVVMVPFMAMIQLMPCWTVIGDQLLLASNTNVFAAQVAALKSDTPLAPSLTDAAEFKKLTDNLPSQVYAIRYYDTRLQVQMAMSMLQQYWPMLTMFVNKEGANVPVILPNISAYIGRMQPAIEYGWIETDGFYSHNRSLLGLSESTAGLAGAALGVSILMPALGKAREQAKKTICLSNMRQVLLSIMMYQEDNDGKMPANLEILSSGYLESKSLICPSVKNGLDSYVFRGADLGKFNQMSALPSWVLIHDKRGNHPGGERNVGFADGHVERVSEAEFQDMIEEDNGLRRTKGLQQKPAE